MKKDWNKINEAEQKIIEKNRETRLKNMANPVGEPFIRISEKGTIYYHNGIQENFVLCLRNKVKNDQDLIFELCEFIIKHRKGEAND